MTSDDRTGAGIVALDNTQIFRRVQALDQLYLNADRRYREWATIDPRADPDSWSRAYHAWQLAQRAYRNVRDTPYRIAADAVDMAGAL